MSRDDSSHLPLRTSHDRRLREDSGPDGSNVIGYQAGNGEVQAFPGDHKFPFVMVPPDLGQPGLYSSDFIPWVDMSQQFGLDIMLQGLPVDVRGIRHLTFYLSIILPGGPREEPLNNALAVVPQVANTISQNDLQLASPSYNVNGPQPPQATLSDLVWHTISVVDPVIRGAFPTAANPAQAFVAPSYGFRNVHMAQLNIPYAPSDGAYGVTEVHTTLVFDVAPYEYFRLLLGRVFVEGLGTVLYPNTLNLLAPPPVGQFRLFVQGQR